MKGLKRKILLLLMFLVLLVFVSACSNNGSDNTQEEIVSTEVETLAELNQAFLSDTTLITLVNDIIVGANEKAIIEDRISDLVLDLNGNKLNGDLNIGSPIISSSIYTTAVSNNWNLEIISSVPGGSITGDLVINDSNVIIGEECEDLVEGEIQDSRPSVSGQISGIVDLEGIDKVVIVALVSNNNLGISSYSELDIVAQTNAGNDGSYNIEGIPSGSYYIVAYQEVNGSDELEFTEINGSMEPVEPNGAYGDQSGEAEKIEVIDNDLIAIDVTLSTEADIYNLNIEVLAPFQGGDGDEPVDNATVSLYGKTSENPLYTTQSNTGNASFTGVYGGHYYLEITNAEVGTTPMFVSKTPVYALFEQNESEDTQTIYLDINMALFSEEDIENIYGVTNVTNGFVLFAEDVDANPDQPLTDEAIEIIPAVADADIGYTTVERIDETQYPYLNFNASSFMEPIEPIIDDTYLSGIRNLSTGTYKIGLLGDSEKETIEVEAGKLVFIEEPEILMD